MEKQRQRTKLADRFNVRVKDERNENEKKANKKQLLLLAFFCLVKITNFQNKEEKAEGRPFEPALSPHTATHTLTRARSWIQSKKLRRSSTQNKNAGIDGDARPAPK